MLETGYGFDKEKKKTEYKRSELRLIETMESLCDRLLSYNIHKERKDSTRFARGVSQTFQTLNNLVDRGAYRPIDLASLLPDSDHHLVVLKKNLEIPMIPNVFLSF